MIRLHMPDGLGFNTKSEQVQPYRAHVTVTVFDRAGREVGQHTERYDTNQKDERELESRFQKWVDDNLVGVPVEGTISIQERLLWQEMEKLREEFGVVRGSVAKAHVKHADLKGEIQSLKDTKKDKRQLRKTGK